MITNNESLNLMLKVRLRELKSLSQGHTASPLQTKEWWEAESSASWFYPLLQTASSSPPVSDTPQTNAFWDWKWDHIQDLLIHAWTKMQIKSLCSKQNFLWCLVEQHLSPNENIIWEKRRNFQRTQRTECLSDQDFVKVIWKIIFCNVQAPVKTRAYRWPNEMLLANDDCFRTSW